MLKGFQVSGKKGLGGRGAAALLIALTAMLSAPSAHATTTLKQVQISNASEVDLLFDGKVQKNQIRTEFINDIIQISIQDVSVYPAKISSVNGGALTKIFAYQYAPKLVRCRLTVRGKAESYRDKLEIKAGGRILTVRMNGETQIAPGRGGDSSPAAKAGLTTDSRAVSQEASGGEPDADERALLRRVMAAGAPQPAAARGKSQDARAAEAAPAPAAAQRSREPSKDSITVSAAAPAAAAPEGAPNTENLPIHLTGDPSPRLAGAKPLPSPLKAFGKMALVLGLFGVCALGFKRYAQGRTDSRLGDAGALTAAATRGGWLGALGRIAKRGLGRDGSMIEVLSTHYLGPKKSIAVVRVAGRLLVLGVSSDSINLITQLSGEDALADAGALGIEGLGLDEPAGPRLKAPAPARAASASAGAGATAAGAAVFSDLLRAERTKPAFANPSAHSAYAAAGISGQATGGAPGASKGGAGVRAQIRNRLEGLKQL